MQSLVIDSLTWSPTLFPSLSEGRQVDESTNPLMSLFVPVATSPSPPSCHLININSGLVTRGLLGVAKDVPVTLLVSLRKVLGLVIEVLSRDPEARTKHTLPVLPHTLMDSHSCSGQGAHSLSFTLGVTGSVA